MQDYILRASMLKEHEYIWKIINKKMWFWFVRKKCIMCNADKAIEVNSYMHFSKEKKMSFNAFIAHWFELILRM